MIDGSVTLIDLISLLLARRFEFEVGNYSQVKEFHPLYKYLESSYLGDNKYFIYFNLSNSQYLIDELDKCALTEVYQTLLSY